MGRLDKEAVEAYKNELKNLWYYMRLQLDLENDIDLMEYDMGGVKGIDYSKEMGGTFNPEATEQRRLKMIEEYNRLLEKKEEIVRKQRCICRVLNCMAEDDRNLVIDVIANHRKYRDVCEERNITSTASLANIINDIIDEAIKKAG